MITRRCMLVASQRPRGDGSSQTRCLRDADRPTKGRNDGNHAKRFATIT